MRDYTIVIHGAMRHDNEAPYLYAVRAESMEQAISVALTAHGRVTDDGDDVEVAHEMCHAGIPTPSAGFWHDFREGVA
ncbi:hypothetical protein [Streptomyces johnsoniae]|uniref:Uncharacterized protein n=1 Tax=Streptomyces johnsoniae TaxID=3075532 RepID=A0ABU2S0U3_9ACTN|nr:hypothetical protein [Streptomyces sp. DSM 41886]MDT0442306.1 hypothetical protein [Streptomyces sp. DSM 41886]